jgi:RimJ/RimL family protein N-acetyltransferase
VSDAAASEWAADVFAVTRRLVLRGWREGDVEPFARLNADPAVTRFVGGPMSQDDSDALLAPLRTQMDEQGYGRFALEHRESGDLLGFTGLGHLVATEAPEIGWRLASAWWRQGFASEAALAVRDLALGRYDLDRIVSVAVPDNIASLGVMRHIGMTPWDERDFDRLRVVVWTMTRDPRG